jgi:MFS transporter, SP family, sugar:H+ symporter
MCLVTMSFLSAGDGVVPGGVLPGGASPDGLGAAGRVLYCIYDSHTLTAFTSSLYLAGLVASLVAGRVTRAIGRQAVMLAGAAVNAAAVNIAMLIVGRMLLGFRIGFTNQVEILYWCSGDL